MNILSAATTINLINKQENLMNDLIKGLFGKLDGRKTAIGLFLYVIGGVITNLGYPDVGTILVETGLTTTGLGALHKIWKGS